MIKQIFLMIPLLFVLAACGGGDSETQNINTTKTTTTGQELMDLQKARDSGAITEEEYEKAKKEILDAEEK